VILIDANVFMYAAGRESPQQQPCRRFLERAVSGEGPDACTDCEVLQEILHRYRALGEQEVAFRVFDAVTHLGLPILDVTERALLEARRILEDYPHLSTRDGIHLGVMRENAIEEVLSYDRGFSQVAWVRRREA
jgi:uncharacterized protein